ncbi:MULTISPECIES: ferredoxin [unclassified Streptomyces]|uniref:ferredoxin n=1 Tax=unclassified Streptomyces TaxID=2593676 RepID=UPI003663AE8D
MKVTAHLTKCRGYGSCMLEAPTVFDLDEDDNRVVVLDEEPPEELRARTERAVRSCPARALQVTG